MKELEKSTCLDETKDISIRLQPILKLGVEGGSEEATRAMIQSGARFRPSTVVQKCSTCLDWAKGHPWILSVKGWLDVREHGKMYVEAAREESARR